ncbi:hypothetical protein ACFQRL_03080 [Microbacterium fluvii]|uniref:Metal-dependent hydrolase n=1 Tax=Microbacterium fluvii TaxID=415215 RepID=A0ABW2H9C3_9MICO|nr:hypothetical protein [Microbacterium fluvii]MCU4671577.1 hypothetical protein [Microbacterium fluvii]
MTLVSFPSGATSGSGRVIAVIDDPSGAVVVTDSTPFHPVDHTWPDQPGDTGHLKVDGEDVEIADAVMAARGADGVFAVGAEIPVKRGVDGWEWFVGHRLATPARLETGAVVELAVDASRRAALSRGHTACHLASLALDAALAELWRKDAPTDPLGHPDFEGMANQTSRIRPDGAVDTYRLGKSLRRSGFDPAALASSLAEREAAIDAKLREWVGSAAVSRVVTDGPSITDRRRWECELPEGFVSFACGGTHVDSLDAFAEITVRLDLTDPALLVMTTSVVPGS